MLILFGFGILLGGVSPTHVAQGAGNKNIWLVKTDARGNMEWNLINDFGSDDYVRAVIQTSDGGFALVGTVYSVYYGRYSPFGLLMKTDAHGVQQWVRSYAREGGDAYDCYSFSAGIQTADDGFLLAGSITNSYSENTIFSSWLVKTDAAGNKQWSGSIGDLYDSSQLNAISQTADGGFVLVGQHLTFVSWPNSWYGYYINDGWLVKLNSNGGVEWEQTYDGGADNDTVKSVTQTAGGGFLLAGSTGGAAWLIKTDASGNKIWDRTYGGGGFNTIIPTTDGGFLLSGSKVGWYDCWLMKVDTNGNIKWQQTYGSGVARAVIETTDGGFVFTGYHGVLVKTDANGIEEWRRIFSGDIEDFCYSVIQTRDGGFALAGFTFNPFITLPGDTTPPTVSSPANIVYEEGMERMTGYVIAWIVGDRNPGTYDLLSNNSVCVDSASWTNGTITWEVDDLTPGTYNFTLIVRDLNRNRTLDTIWVTVFATANPELSAPEDITVEEGTSSRVITWAVGDHFPGTYAIYTNSEQVDSGSWTNGTITWGVDGLTPGTYNVTLVVRDMAQNCVSDTIWVTVFTTAVPELSAPEDIAVEEGTTGHIITWAVGDRYPGTYAIYTNSGQVDSGLWTNGTIIWNVDGLPQGTYNVTLDVWDAAGNRISDSVWVTVTAPTTPPVPELPVISKLILLSLVTLATFGVRRKRPMH